MNFRLTRPRAPRAHTMLLLLAALVGATPAPGAAQDEPQLRFSTRALELGVGGRLQALFSTTDAPRADPLLWELRRVRLDFDVRAHPRVRARIQPEFGGNRVELRDAFVEFQLDPALKIRAGQAFRPFSLIAQTSTTRILPIERGARIRGRTPLPLDHYNLISSLGYADRDVGLQLRGEPENAPLDLTYAVGVFNGPLAGIAGGEPTYQLAARLTVSPMPDVRLGAGWSRRDFGEAAAEDERQIRLRSGSAWEVDLQVGGFDAGPILLAEVAWGMENPFFREEERFVAGQIWAAYRTEPRGEARIQLEPVARLSVGRPDATDDARAAGRGGGLLFTPGLNLYLGPLNRVMLNYDFWDPIGPVPAGNSFKAMFQMAF